MAVMPLQILTVAKICMFGKFGTPTPGIMWWEIMSWAQVWNQVLKG
jgi:hypothetical protein